MAESNIQRENLHIYIQVGLQMYKRIGNNKEVSLPQ